jgi:hypothetical protein
MFTPVEVNRLDADLQHIKLRIADYEPYDAGTAARIQAETREVDGVPNVDRRLAELCDELRKVMKGIRFGMARTGGAVHAGDYIRVQALCVYNPDQEYVLGRIGCCDEGNYKLYSRTITNQKFNEGKDEYHTVSTKSMDKMIRQAKKYLRPHSAVELSIYNSRSVSNHVQKIYSTLHAEDRNTHSDCAYHNSFFREMNNLLVSNHMFIDPTFKLSLMKYVEAATNKEKAGARRRVAGRFVYLREEAGEQVCDIVYAPDVEQARYAQTKYPPTTIKLTDMDETMAHKIAALSMLQNDGFVEGLGLKVNAKMYWVFE